MKIEELPDLETEYFPLTEEEQEAFNFYHHNRGTVETSPISKFRQEKKEEVSGWDDTKLFLLRKDGTETCLYQWGIVFAESCYCGRGFLICLMNAHPSFRLACGYCENRYILPSGDRYINRRKFGGETFVRYKEWKDYEAKVWENAERLYAEDYMKAFKRGTSRRNRWSILTSNGVYYPSWNVYYKRARVAATEDILERRGKPSGLVRRFAQRTTRHLIKGTDVGPGFERDEWANILNYEHLKQFLEVCGIKNPDWDTLGVLEEERTDLQPFTSTERVRD